MPTTHRPALAAALALAAAATFPALATPTFTGLGFLPSGFDSNGWVSGDGRVVAGYCNQPGGYRAYRWTSAGGMTNLGTVSGYTFSRGAAVNFDGGAIAGVAGSGPAAQAARWTQADGFQLLGLLDGTTHSYAQGISGDGQTVVGYSGDNIGGSSTAFVWTAAGNQMIPLNPAPGAGLSSAYAASEDGLVIAGTSGGGSAIRAARWTPSATFTAQPLDPLPGDTWSAAYGISANSRVIVGYTGNSSRQRAFRWTTIDGMVSIGTLGGNGFATALACNADGSVIVGTVYLPDTFDAVAFIWTQADGIANLNTYLASRGVNLTGWTLTSAGSISNDGRVIAGIGAHNGATEAWTVTLDPPAAAACNLADVASLGGAPTPDGALTSDDVIVFLGTFFSGNAIADVAVLGGAAGHDGQFTADDLILFLGAFFAGCP